MFLNCQNTSTRNGVAKQNDLILVFLTIFYDFLMILQPHNKFEPSESIFSEIPRFHGLIPIIACRSAKMAAKHLRVVP